MRLLVLTHGELTRDPRARRQVAIARTLGWEVVGACPSVPGAPPVPLDGVTVVRTAPERLTDRLRSAGYGGVTRRSRPLVRELRGLYRLVRLVRSSLRLAAAARSAGRCDVIHANELETLVAGWIVRSRVGGRLVYDAHEYYPDCYPDPPRLHQAVTAAVERLLARRADAVIAVGGEIADELQRALKLRARPHVVLNTPARFPVDIEQRAEGAPLRVVYQASVGASRPIDDLFAAMAASHGAHLTIRLANVDVEALRREVAARGLADRVDVVDPVSPEQLLEALVPFDVGVVISRPLTLNDRLALPNKLFEYMAAGLALAVPDLPAMGGLVEREQIGVRYDPQRPETLGAELDRLAADREAVRALRERSAAAAVDRYNAETGAVALEAAWRGDDERWQPMQDRRSAASRVAAALATPVAERRFTHAEYLGLLDKLGAAGANVVPLRELESAPRDRPVVSLRHDVDLSLADAIALAELEASRDVCSTYFLLHTAPYWARGDVEGAVQQLERMGHEVGLHHDLGTAWARDGADPATTLAAALARLRDAGADVRGVAAHGSFVAHRAGVDNTYFFAGWDVELPGLPNVAAVPKLDPQAFGLEYEAYRLRYDRYWSDAQFDQHGWRWHPSLLDPGELKAGEAAVILLHPDHWHTSAGAKAGAVYGRLLTRLVAAGQNRTSG